MEAKKEDDDEVHKSYQYPDYYHPNVMDKSCVVGSFDPIPPWNLGENLYKGRPPNIMDPITKFRGVTDLKEARGEKKSRDQYEKEKAAFVKYLRKQETEAEKREQANLKDVKVTVVGDEDLHKEEV